MIYVGENKAVICKGDFHPARLYKGDKKIAGYNVEEFEGENGVTLESCYNDKLHNTQIFGNTVQDGTPTPEAPVEVQSVGELVTEGDYAGKYKIPVRVRGKNLIDKNSISITPNYYRLYKKNGDLITIQGNEGADDYAASGGTLRFTPPETLPSGTYTFSMHITLLEEGIWGTGARIYAGAKTPYQEKLFYYNSNTVGARRRIKFTGTFSDGLGGIVMRLNGNKWLVDISSLQIEKGSEVTEYEPYIEPQTFNIYLDEPLRKLGDYADYVDFEKEQTIRQIGASKLTNFRAYPNSATPNTYWAKSTAYATKNDRVPILTEYYPYSGTSAGYAKVAEIVYANRPSVGKFHTASGLEGAIFISDDRFTTAEDLNSWIKSNNVLFYYRLMNNLIQDIDLPELPTFKGTTIYEIATEIPATISGKYKKVEE